jgi:hypothetical protein
MMTNKYIMSDEEKYFFDLVGYLIVRGAMSVEEVAECNRAIDEFADQTESDGLSGGLLGWPEPYREPFRRLLVHPVVVPRLNEISGPGFRLDQGPLLVSSNQDVDEDRLLGGGEPFAPEMWYHQQNGIISCSGVTVAWQLTDVNAGDGGFGIVPGSHKATEPTPEGVNTMDDDMGVVRQLEMKAGDVLFFAETATHGTLPWSAAHEQRSVMYKYAARAAVRAIGRHFDPEEVFGDWTKELTPEQRAVLFGAGIDSEGRLPVLNSDGQRNWIGQRPR